MVKLNEFNCHTLSQSASYVETLWQSGHLQNSSSDSDVPVDLNFENKILEANILIDKVKSTLKDIKFRIQCNSKDDKNCPGRKHNVSLKTSDVSIENFIVNDDTDVEQQEMEEIETTVINELNENSDEIDVREITEEQDLSEPLTANQFQLGPIEEVSESEASRVTPQENVVVLDAPIVEVVEDIVAEIVESAQLDQVQSDDSFLAKRDLLKKSSEPPIERASSPINDFNLKSYSSVEVQATQETKSICEGTTDETDQTIKVQSTERACSPIKDMIEPIDKDCQVTISQNLCCCCNIVCSKSNNSKFIPDSSQSEPCSMQKFESVSEPRSEPTVTKPRTPKLSIQTMPSVSIKRPLVMQRTLNLNIKPTGSGLNIVSSQSPNVGYREIRKAGDDGANESPISTKDDLKTIDTKTSPSVINQCAPDCNKSAGTIPAPPQLAPGILDSIQAMSITSFLSQQGVLERLSEQDNDLIARIAKQIELAHNDFRNLPADVTECLKSYQVLGGCKHDPSVNDSPSTLSKVDSEVYKTFINPEGCHLSPISPRKTSRPEKTHFLATSKQKNPFEIGFYFSKSTQCSETDFNKARCLYDEIPVKERSEKSSKASKDSSLNSIKEPSPISSHSNSFMILSGKESKKRVSIQSSDVSIRPVRTIQYSPPEETADQSIQVTLSGSSEELAKEPDKDDLDNFIIGLTMNSMKDIENFQQSQLVLSRSPTKKLSVKPSEDKITKNEDMLSTSEKEKLQYLENKGVTKILNKLSSSSESPRNSKAEGDSTSHVVMTISCQPSCPPIRERFSEQTRITSYKSDPESTTISESISEGEIHCNCSISSGEVHSCKYLNNIRNNVRCLKRNPETIIRQKLTQKTLKIARQRAYYQNWIAYYLQKEKQVRNDSSSISTNSHSK